MIRFTIFVSALVFSACNSGEPVSDEIPPEVRKTADSTVQIMNDNLSHHEKESDTLIIDTVKSQK